MVVVGNHLQLIVDKLLVLSSELESLWVCDGEGDGLVSVLIDGDEGSACVCNLQLLLVSFHSVSQGVQATGLCVALLVEMVLKWDYNQF